MVGTTGFEPAASPTPRVRATGLRYVPTGLRGAQSTRLGAKGSVSLAFEKRQEGLQGVAQIQ